MACPTITRRALLDRWRVGVLGTAAVGLLAACGGTAAVSTSSSTVSASAAVSTSSAASASSTKAAAATTTSKAVAASTSAAAAVPTVPAGTVDFWQWGSGYVPGFNTLATNFNKSQKVQVVAANPSDYWNKVVTTQAGPGSAPAESGPTRSNPKESTLAIEPPPAPISIISMTWVLMGSPDPLLKR